MLKKITYERMISLHDMGLRKVDTSNKEQMVDKKMFEIYTLIKCKVILNQSCI